jgi:pimeloyl-ACP methyl ester carboxylesterase
MNAAPADEERAGSDEGQTNRRMKGCQPPWFSGWILAALAATGCAAVVPATDHSPVPHSSPTSRSSNDSRLAARVAEYLRVDDQEAGRILPSLVNRPPAELESVLDQVLSGPLLWEDEPPKTGLLPNLPIQVDGTIRRYGLYVPPSYQPARSYPLIICLHGAGFNGDSYLDRWSPRLGERYLLACPSIADGAWWTRDGELLVMAVFDEVARRYHVDRDRVFLTGMSNGGLGTYLIGLNHTDQFAALIPMAGSLPRGFYPLFDNATRTPLYLIHGAHDQVIPVSFSRNIAAYLKQEGIPFVYREHEQIHPMAGGHFFPKDELPALMAWLDAQHRPSPAPTLTVVRDRDHTGRAGWVRLDRIDPSVGSFWASEYDAEAGRRLERGAFARLSAVREGNTLHVTAKGVRRYNVLFYPDAVDFGRPVTIVTNGLTSFEGVITPESRTLLEEARRRPDPARLVMATVGIDVPL